MNISTTLASSENVINVLDQERAYVVGYDLVSRCVRVDAIAEHAGGKATLGRAVSDDYRGLGCILLLGPGGNGVVDGVDRVVVEGQWDDLVNL